MKYGLHVGDSAVSEPPERKTRPVWLWSLAVVSAVLLVLAGWGAALIFESPEQREARADPPAPEPIFAEVTNGDLADQTTLAGVVEAAHEWRVAVTPASGVVRSVVTARPILQGSEYHAGSVITEINGRPLFYVQSDFDFYRDLRFGDSGPDVEKLQNMLISLGLLDRADGAFGVATARAITDLYESEGYDAPLETVPESTPPVSGGETPSSEQVQVLPAPARPYVPVSELAAVGSDAAVALGAVGIGQRSDGEQASQIRLGATDLVVRIALPSSFADVPEVGTSASVSVAGTEMEGSVGAVVHAEADDAAEDSQTLVDLQTKDPLPSSAIGSPASVTFTTKLVAESALLVPVSAVVQQETETFVLRRTEDGTQERITVDVLGTLRGTAAVVVRNGGALVAGDQVRVA